MVQLVVIQVAEHQMDHHMITGLYFNNNNWDLRYHCTTVNQTRQVPLHGKVLGWNRAHSVRLHEYVMQEPRDALLLVSIGSLWCSIIRCHYICSTNTPQTFVQIWKCKTSPPNESSDQNILNRDQSQEDFLSHLFTNEKETNEDEKNESGNIFFLVLDSWYSPALVRGSLLPFLAHEVGVPDYESINTADDSTLDPKPKKGTRRSRRKSCTDVKVICSIYRLYMTRHGFRVSFEPKIRL